MNKFANEDMSTPRPLIDPAPTRPLVDPAPTRPLNDPQPRPVGDPIPPPPLVDPVPEPVIDPVPEPERDLGAMEAARWRRAEHASRVEPRPAGPDSYTRSVERRIPSFERGYSGLDVAGTLVAAAMTIGPLFGGYLTNLHS